MVNDPNYVVKRHKVTNSGQTLTREEALANRVRTPTPPAIRFRTPTPPVRVNNNNSTDKCADPNSTISPIKPRSNVTINLPETPDTTEEENQEERSMEDQDSESTAFLLERMEAARAMNSFINNIVSNIRIPQMMNATIPSNPNPNWHRDPNPREQEILPEHVALVVHTESNTILRSLYFWQRHDPWDIIQSMVHEDVILYPNGQVEDSDIMDPRPWSPTHTPLSSTDATAGSPPTQQQSVVEVDSSSRDPASMSMTCITISSGQSSSSISNLSISEEQLPESNSHDDRNEEQEEEDGGDQEKEGEGHATQGRHSHVD